MTTDICWTMCRGDGSPWFLILNYVAPLVIGLFIGFIIGWVNGIRSKYEK